MPNYDVQIIKQDPYSQYPDEVVFSRTLHNLEEAQGKGHDELIKYEASYILHGETWRKVSDNEWQLGGEIHCASVKLRK